MRLHHTLSQLRRIRQVVHLRLIQLAVVVLCVPFLIKGTNEIASLRKPRYLALAPIPLRLLRQLPLPPIPLDTLLLIIRVVEITLLLVYVRQLVPVALAIVFRF